MPAEPHITIVGGGFSGAAVAIHLLGLMPEGLRVTLLEPRTVPGAGVAYSTAEPSHRINVPASRMQLAGEEEGAFDRWYRSQPLLLTIRRRGVKTARCTPSAASSGATSASVLPRRYGRAAGDWSPA